MMAWLWSWYSRVGAGRATRVGMGNSRGIVVSYCAYIRSMSVIMLG